VILVLVVCDPLPSGRGFFWLFFMPSVDYFSPEFPISPMNKTTYLSVWMLMIYGFSYSSSAFGQMPLNPFSTDTLVMSQVLYPDSTLRIRNLTPYFNLHVDSTLSYNLEINKDPSHYFWFLENPLLGLKINKDNGLLTFKAEKSYFLSGRLKYDFPYKIGVGIQNLQNPSERLDTSFTIQFFTTEIIPSHLKPSVNSTLFVNEGDTVNFRMECEDGSFPIQSIGFFSNLPIKDYQGVKKCDDEFK